MTSFLYAFVVLSVGMVLSSCQRAEKDQTTPMILSLSGIHSSATTGLSDMNCFGVIVSGPEKDLQKYSCQYSNGEVLSAGFNFGMFLGGFYNDGTLAGSQIQIDVPNGSDRVLRLVGMKVDTSSSVLGTSNKQACEEFKTGLNRHFFEAPYVIAQSSALQLKGEDLPVDMTAAFDSTKQLASCGGLGLEASKGIPAKLAVILQDQPANALKRTSSQSCVGVKFQIQDVFNKPATVTSAFSAEITETVAGLSIGNFYYPVAAPGVDICGTTNLVPTSGGKIPLSFVSGSSLSNEVVLYFRPSAATMAARNIEVISSTGGLKSGARQFQYEGTPTPVPTKYAFYDLFSNTSSVTAVTSTPVGVRRNECRLGAVQFLDQYATPSALTTSANTPDLIYVSGHPLGTVQFFQTQANCTSGASASTDVTVAMAASSTATGFGFFYKVVPTAAGSVSFKVMNLSTTPYPVITSGDLSFSSNVWQISD